MIRTILGTTAIAVVLAAAASPASAQQFPFSSTTAFGDSLSDTGNLAQFGAVPTAPYVDGRFTSAGGVWVDYFDNITGAPATSRAFGGARAIRTTPTDLTAQVTAFLAGNPTITSSQLFSIWIGGNDYLALLDPTRPPPSTAEVTTTIGGVATAIGTQAGRLRAAGAQNFILFNLPPLGQIPATSTSSASARNDANTLSALHAEAVNGVAASLRASGATVVVADMRTLFLDLLARPQVYGFANTTVPCFAPTATAPLAATGACATAAATNASVFYDLIHPTSAAHQVVAQFANGSVVTTLVSPQGLSTLSQLSFSLFDQSVASIAGRMSGARTGTGNVGIQAVQTGADSRWGVYTFGSWATADYDAFTGQLGYEQDSWNAGVGIDYQVDDVVTAGLAFSYGDGEIDLDNGAGTVESSSYTGLAYVTVAADAIWGDFFLGYSYDDLISERSTGFVPLPIGRGDTFSHTYGLGGTVGYTFETGGVGFGPVASLRYIDLEIDGFTEAESGPLALTVDKMRADSLQSRLGGQVAGRFGDSGLAIIPSLEVAWQHEFLNDDRPISATLPGGERALAFPGAGDRESVYVAGSLAVETKGGLLASLGYTGTVAGGNGDSHAISARIRFTY